MYDPLEMTDLREYPKEVAMRDGSRVWLRPMTKDDGERVFSFFKALPEKDRRYFKHDVSRRSTIDAWCEGLNYDLTLPILAVTHRGNKDKVVANGTLHSELHGWSTHVARIRLQVHPDFRLLGLGQAMLRELCDRAAMRGVGKIQALVRADNIEGLRLMKKLGFRKEGTFKNHAITKQGARHDVAILFQDLEDLWKRMEDLNMDLDTPTFLP